MGVHKHDAHTKTDRLIAAVEALTAETRKLSALLDDSERRMVPSSVWYGKMREAADQIIADDVKKRGPLSQALKSAS